MPTEKPNVSRYPMEQEQRTEKPCPVASEPAAIPPISTPSAAASTSPAEQAETSGSVRHPGKLGNENATKSGLRMWTVSARIPAAYRSLRRELKRLPLDLAAELKSHKGRAPSTYELAVISTVVRHTGRIALLERWLAKEHKTLEISARLALLKEIGAASTSRDKALESLGLGKERDSITSLWDSLDARRRTIAGQVDTPVNHAYENATEAIVGDSGASPELDNSRCSPSKI